MIKQAVDKLLFPTLQVLLFVLALAAITHGHSESVYGADQIIPQPFWRKVGLAPSFAPSWYNNKNGVSSEFHYNPALSASENGNALEQVLENLSSGDHILIHQGTYVIDSWFRIKTTGTAENPVVIRGAPGESVVITRSNASQNVINIDDTTYLIIENIVIRGGSTGLKLYAVDYFMLHASEIHDTAGNAIAVNSADTSYLYFIDNNIHDTGGHGEGFYLGAHDGSKITHHTYVVGNYVHDLNASDVSQGDGIEVKWGSYAVTVKYNFVRNTNYPGIITYGTGRGLSDRNIVEENVVIDSDDNAFQISAETIVRNNLVINGQGGAFVSKPDRINPKHLSVVNNTFVNDGWAVRTTGWNNAEAVGIVFANNALYSASGQYIRNGTGNATASSNIQLDDLAAAFVSLDSSGNELNATPRDASPLIGTGNAAYMPPLDLHGRSRITGVDVGAVDHRDDDNIHPSPPTDLRTTEP